MGQVRRAILWGAATRHAASAHERRLKARCWAAAQPEQAVAAELDAEQWEQAMMGELHQLGAMRALPVAIDAVVRNKSFVKKVLADGSLDGVELRQLDVVSLELLVSRMRTTLVDMVLLEQKRA